MAALFFRSIKHLSMTFFSESSLYTHTRINTDTTLWKRKFTYSTNKTIQWRKITTSILIIYVRKRGDTKRTKKELQEFASYFEVMKNESVDAKWNMFEQRLTGIMDSCIPHKFTTSRHNLTWLNGSLRRQTRKRRRLYNTAKKREGSLTGISSN